MFSYIDATGITTLRNIVNLYERRGVRVLLTDVAAHVRTQMAADLNFYQEVPASKIYITIHDAVHRALEEMKLLKEMKMLQNRNTDITLTSGLTQHDASADVDVKDKSPKNGTTENPFFTIEMNNEVREEVTPKVKKKMSTNNTDIVSANNVEQEKEQLLAESDKEV